VPGRGEETFNKHVSLQEWLTVCSGKAELSVLRMEAMSHAKEA
jgi:hypothetical protein